jgi:hypothetical protein
MSCNRGACDGRGVFVAPLAQLLLSHLPLLNSTPPLNKESAVFPPFWAITGQSAQCVTPPASLCGLTHWSTTRLTERTHAHSGRVIVRID